MITGSSTSEFQIEKRKPLGRSTSEPYHSHHRVQPGHCSKMREDRNGYGSRKEGFQTAKLRRSCPNVGVGLTPWKSPPCHGENTARTSLVMLVKSVYYGKQPRILSKNCPIWPRTEKEREKFDFPADFRRVFVLARRARGRAAQLLAGLAHRGVRLIDDADPT